MKKTYIQPNMFVVEMKLKQILMSSIETTDSSGSVQMQGELDTSNDYEIF